MYELTFSLKYYMNFSISEIDNMTTHESKAYIDKFKEAKTKEKEAIDKVKSGVQGKRINRRGSNKKRGGK